MLRRLILVSMTLTLIWSATGCSLPSAGDPYTSQPPIAQSPTNEAPVEPVAVTQTRLADGQYPVQQATYDDATGEYTLLLLNTQPGDSSVFRTANLPLARLTDEQIAAGQSSSLTLENGQPALYLTPDFRIEYVHNVTETQTNPQTGQPEVVVVRQEPSFWSPFAGALAGQAIGSLLFRPQYYVPPIYQPGAPLVGFGGYGSTYGQAVNRYQSRYQAPPAAVRNRQVLRTSGRLRAPNPSVRRTNPSYGNSRSTGSGYGSSNLQRNNRPTYRRPSGGGFGTGRSRSLGGRRR